MMIAWATLIKCSHDANKRSSFNATPVAARPTNIANIATAMVDVLRGLVISKNELAGIKRNNTAGRMTALAAACEDCNTTPCAASAALAVRPTAVRPNNFAIKTPTPAATMVVSINMPMVSTLILLG